ncbi:MULTISPECIES: EAL domain-containing protein [unclassified Aureimonas]|uniref:EAL domain-containing protein n=1 Tax=unclassified Aureimonas TaxID=2615206 RepID=UPI0006F9F3FE|nr:MULTISPECIES: EAL domain-containing protein [unclassified Aureimonas]KQT52403.1 hypothetical protein ASG62_14330 [Aureimonas sp. Leaf427]KQT74920.1 hypothetical protein ASG54_16170 [Aureimonas sp. Leaf460]
MPVISNLRRSPKRLLASALLGGLIAACFLVADLAGLFSALDNRLSELRFASQARAPTGDIVLVDIDARSIGEIGVWPWPRRLYGDLLSAAAKSGAAKVAFDIDFSSASNEADDAAFATALAGAGVETYLAAFAQPETAGATTLRMAMPIELLLRVSWPASVDVPLDADGQIRRFPHASDRAGETLASLPSVLAGRDGKGLFGIDYGISASDIPRVSFVDLLGGRIAPGVLSGKSLIVGASAVELHDLFSVPVFGTVSGSTVLALATETLLQNRDLAAHSFPAPIIALVALVALVLTARLRMGAAVGLLALAMLSLEATAWWLQLHGAIVLETARLQGGGLGIIVWTLLRELTLGRLRLWIARIQMTNTESMLERVVDASFDGIVILDDRGVVARANAEAAALLGLAMREFRRLDDLPEALQVSVRSLLRSGLQGGAPVDRTLRQIVLPVGADDRVLEYSIAPFEMKALGAHEASGAGSTLHLCLTLRDVTDRERSQARLRHLALHDSLTGLGNRRALEAAIAALSEVPGEAGGVALLVFDLDRFKAVNDTLGHGTGDEVLIETAARARQAFGPDAFLSRIGGDEFAVLLRCGGAEAACEAARRFLASVAEPFQIKGHRICVASSIGIGWWPPGTLNATDMLRQADTALYRAKSRSAATVVVFESGMDVDRLARLALEADIEQALDRGEFEVVYQPQVLLETAEIIGAEALVRWRHPVRGYVSPVQFIPVAEEMGFIHRLGAFVLEAACLEAAGWPAEVKLAVNVSALQFEAGDVVSAVRYALSRSGLAPGRLELEITESAFAAETSRLREALDALTALGIDFALDDYGTGYASIGYLHRFPISKIKIDRSFITDAPTHPQTVAVLRSILTLGDGLGIRVIAEGIETSEQADVLAALGCREGQGYLYSKPISGLAFRSIVNGLVNPPSPLLRIVA